MIQNNFLSNRHLHAIAWTVFFLICLGLPSLSRAEATTSSKFNQILKDGVLRVGVSLFTPWTFKDKNEKLIGFEIDVAKKLAKDMGVTPKLIAYDWEKLIPALNDGKIDIIIGGMAITPKRALKVNFSSPYATAGTSLATNIKLTKDIKDQGDIGRSVNCLDMLNLMKLCQEQTFNIFLKLIPFNHLNQFICPFFGCENSF